MTPKPGRRRQYATILDVAERAGVSRAAVSKVIGNAYGVSDAMRTKVETAMADLDYRPSATARALRGRSSTIGIEAPDAANPFLAQILRGVMDTIEDSDYQVVLAPAWRQGTHRLRAIETLVDQRVDGILAVSPLTGPDRLRRIAERTPLVVLGDHDLADGYDTVTTDDARGADLVMAHLRGLGHRRIAHITIDGLSSGENRTAPHAARLAQYEAQMREIGEPRRVFTVRDDADALGLARDVFSAPDAPTAIFAGHDSLAFHALQARTELGLGPSQMSIVGFDGVELAGHRAFSLTTVDQHGHEMGARAAALLLERIDGRDEAEHVVTDPDLIERASSAAVIADQSAGA